ncbi:hypothetical protein PPYR_11677 [Photinus pyralis]|uniref:Uncharacterized protein n=2 Tax=Photinus pyralis TaxID=7054 RepID=A0A5N4AC61_PHOPY|nr:cuticle protein 18.7 [Photinus pyralis]KAB0794838.1 hypothetical protein PPYR_11677 [Photinus pyralis]
MKYFVVLSVVLAVASATHPYAYGHLYGQHIPLIDHSGVPVDTPDVQAAKALHFSAHAVARSGIFHEHSHPLSYAAGLYHHHYPVVDGAGRPIDTPEVAHAKAAHFAAYNEAAARNSLGHVAPLVAVAGHHHGVVDTPEVQIAKAAHFAAHAKAAHGHVLKRRSAVFPYPHHIPVIDHTGVPVETPEVQAAKAEHFAAHAKASAEHVGAAHLVSHPIVPYAAVHAKYPIHIPVITPHGVPVETPEVQHSKAAHFAAHAEASARNAAIHYHHGLPLHHY